MSIASIPFASTSHPIRFGTPHGRTIAPAGDRDPIVTPPRGTLAWQATPYAPTGATSGTIGRLSANSDEDRGLARPNEIDPVRRSPKARWEGTEDHRLPPPASPHEASPATHRRPRRVGVGHGSPAAGPSRAAAVSGPVPSREDRSSRRDSRSAALPARRRGDRCSRGRFPLRSLGRDPHDRSHGPRPRSAGDTGRPRFQSLPVEFDSRGSGSTGHWRDRAGPRLEPLLRLHRGWPRPPRRFRGPGHRRNRRPGTRRQWRSEIPKTPDLIARIAASHRSETRVESAPGAQTYEARRTKRANPAVGLKAGGGVRRQVGHGDHIPRLEPRPYTLATFATTASVQRGSHTRRHGP